jgi:phage minor structural protein
MANRTGINARYSGINATIPESAAPSFVDTQQEPYRLELRQQDGTLVYFLTNWWAGTWTEKTLAPSTIRFSYDATNEFADSFVFPNEVWLYKGDNTTVQQKFIITSPSDSESEGYVFDVESKSLIYQLTKELVDDYSVTVDTNISQIVQDLLDFQTQTPVIGIGKIDRAIGDEQRTWKVENKTILEALYDLQRTVGGYFEVDVNRRLNWRRSIGFDLGHQIRLGKNSTLVTRTIDYTDLATRIIAYGFGVEKDVRLTVTVNDASAQSSFGIIVGYFNDKSINDIDMLTEAANAELNRRKTPRTTYDIGVIDLSQGNSTLDYSFEATALTLGTRLNLIGGQSDVDIYTRVQEITRNLDNPLDVKVSVSNPDAGTSAWGGNEPRQSTTESLEDFIVELFKAAKRVDNDVGTIDTIKRLIDGGTIETPPVVADRIDTLEQVIWMNDGRLEDPPSTDPPTIGEPDKEKKEDAIADAITEVLDAGGTGGHNSDTYDDLVAAVAAELNIIDWEPTEATALPTLPTSRPKVVYWKSTGGGTGDDQLWIGYNGSGSADQWTPMQYTTDKSGGTPT